MYFLILYFNYKPSKRALPNWDWFPINNHLDSKQIWWTASSIGTKRRAQVRAAAQGPSNDQTIDWVRPWCSLTPTWIRKRWRRGTRGWRGLTNRHIKPTQTCRMPLPSTRVATQRTISSSHFPIRCHRRRAITWTKRTTCWTIARQSISIEIREGWSIK